MYMYLTFNTMPVELSVLFAVLVMLLGCVVFGVGVTQDWRESGSDEYSDER